MKPNFSFLSKLLILQYLSVLCISQEFDFFYFVQQWPGAYCDTKQSCCYPKIGKPAAILRLGNLLSIIFWC
ncbi:Extracellular ribonuclease LE [Glycine soja]|uniref:Extracellular ribonuclease LE n=1 Tax=Glycine soja TaxID=3848 RepID=A0A0B2RH10_GLYSO|nr:Extracellular ribonuclease LE [Glycine soja]